MKGKSEREHQGIRYEKTITGYPGLENPVEIIERKGSFPDEKDQLVKVGQVHYILREIVGEGGMAVVWKADRVFTGKEETNADDIPGIVAVKRAFCLDDALEEAIVKEAKINLGIFHQQVLTPLYFGHHNGGYTLVMPFVSSDLEKIMEAHRISQTNETPPEFWDENKYLLHYSEPHISSKECIKAIPDKFVAYFIYMVARTLAHLHRKAGIVHRDISANNILVEPSTGAVYLADFGVALEKGEKNIMVAGKLQYISPEGLKRPHESDQRSDLYSLGVVAYKMLTGLGPNDIFTEPEKVTSHQQRMWNNINGLMKLYERPVVPPHLVVEGIDKKLSRMVLKLLATDPDERYRSAAEFVRDIKDNYLHRGPGPTPEGLSAYLHIFANDVERMRDEDILDALDELKFLPRRKGVPVIFQRLVLSKDARLKLAEKKNPARA
ncbi:MAG: serine/threonine protein kinase [Nanoarchaeota archaeon]|nr:serine/threonine protein kinase [Nanoarchaeota archaeon]